MPLKAKELSALEVGRLKTPKLHFVGGVAGLGLQVTSKGARSWVLRVTIGSKRRDMGLGGYPDVPLAAAREKARQARELIDSGIDPILARDEAKSRLKANQLAAVDFEHCAAAYVSAHASSWRNAKHAAQWESTLKNYVYPVLGSMLVRDINVSHVMRVIEPIWAEKTETASRVRGRLETVLDWAAVRGYRDGLNPARWRGHLDKLLPARSKVQKRSNFAAVAVQDVPAVLQRVRAVDGMGARALEFLILTAARSGEVRGACWQELDLEAAVWTVPAERMKANREHRVPLCKRAVKLLRGLDQLAGTDLVFWSPRGKVLSDMTLTVIMRRLGIAATVHGFRSTFRDWAAECTNFPRDVAEMALAHTIGDKVEAAYRRGDLFTKRTLMMNAWAEYLEAPRGKGEVVSLRKNNAF